jgi:hypothetical protein
MFLLSQQVTDGVHERSPTEDCVRHPQCERRHEDDDAKNDQQKNEEPSASAPAPEPAARDRRLVRVPRSGSESAPSLRNWRPRRPSTADCRSAPVRQNRRSPAAIAAVPAGNDNRASLLAHEKVVKCSPRLGLAGKKGGLAGNCPARPAVASSQAAGGPALVSPSHGAEICPAGTKDFARRFIFALETLVF